MLGLLAASCAGPQDSVPDEFNRRAYALRYTDIDSSLYYAQKARMAAHDNPSAGAEALNNIAYVLYQRMEYSRALSCTDSVYLLTNNQVELMCADVMRMKISQRTCDLRTFYRSWHSAESRLRRIDEQLRLLSTHLQERVLYARTEMHIIASTYYYYTGQGVAAGAQIQSICDFMRAPSDTTQWLSYLYMIGSGGILHGDSTQVQLEEFDYLTRAWAVSEKTRNYYYEANTLQALAVMLETPQDRELISTHKGGSLDYIMGRHLPWMTKPSLDSLPMAMTRHSFEVFRRYGDMFQMANVLRTKSELLFHEGRYREALTPITHALKIVEWQHKLDTLRCPLWEASIHERLSLTYSALGDKVLADHHRNSYLDLIDSMSQDLEEGVRASELRVSNQRLYIQLAIIVIIVSIVICALVWLSYKVRQRVLRQRQDSEEQTQYLHDTIQAKTMQLHNERIGNIERRAKVTLAESIVPLIHRMLKTTDTTYVSELAQEILRINNTLTQWIQIRSGHVAMHITTFPLSEVLNIVAKNRPTFERAGITLHITPTDVSVKADKALTLFMINTLCDNALKFTPQGGSIHVTTQSNDQYVEISVTDTGRGLPPESVDTINNSKVFRLKTEGTGFGLMNCKGIIGSMKKLSRRFECCKFGVESTLGQGSRFYFRLPRVMSLLLLIFLSTTQLHSAPLSQAQAYCDSLRDSNIRGDYAKAVEWGSRALAQVPDQDIRLRMNIENEMAIALQALHRWDEYQIHNRKCIELHRRLTADPNLPEYAEQLHRYESESKWAMVFTLVLITISILLLILIIRRSRHRRKERDTQEEVLLTAYEQLNRITFELDRIHIQNQILDNSLSTIKHETMYYPSRILQMVSQDNHDLSEVRQVSQYYNEVYTTLLEQAQRITAKPCPLDDSILDELHRRLDKVLAALATGRQYDTRKHTIRDSRKTTILIEVRGIKVPDTIFTSSGGSFDAFVAREIVRIHDAQSGYPGLRLYVENNVITITLWNNSKLLLSKTSSSN